MRFEFSRARCPTLPRFPIEAPLAVETMNYILVRRDVCYVRASSAVCFCNRRTSYRNAIKVTLYLHHLLAVQVKVL